MILKNCIYNVSISYQIINITTENRSCINFSSCTVGKWYTSPSVDRIKLSMIVWLFVYIAFRPIPDYINPIQTSPLSVKGCKVYANARCVWPSSRDTRDLYRARPALTWDLNVTWFYPRDQWELKHATVQGWRSNEKKTIEVRIDVQLRYWNHTC